MPTAGRARSRALLSSPRRQQHRRTSPLQRFKSCLQFRVLLISSLQGLITSDFIRRFKRTTGASVPRSTSGCTSGAPRKQPQSTTMLDSSSAAWVPTKTAAPSPSSPKAKVSTYLTTGARGKHLTAPFSYPALRLRLSASFSLCIQSLSLMLFPQVHRRHCRSLHIPAWPWPPGAC